MPIAYLIQTRGKGVSQTKSVYHLHLTDEPDSLCSRAVVGQSWRSVGDLQSFLNTPEGLFVRQKRMCAICAALEKPYRALDQARHKVEAT